MKSQNCLLTMFAADWWFHGKNIPWNMIGLRHYFWSFFYFFKEIYIYIEMYVAQDFFSKIFVLCLHNQTKNCSAASTYYCIFCHHWSVHTGMHFFVCLKYYWASYFLHLCFWNICNNLNFISTYVKQCILHCMLGANRF